MKKRGMIPEKYRVMSEKKWDYMVSLLEAGAAPGFIDDKLRDRCGYCFDITERTGRRKCGGCYIPKSICNDGGKVSLCDKVGAAVKSEDIRTALKYAVKIRDYIRSDKP
jgi:hypothetical protein